MFSETYSIGKSSNPADSLPKAGKKTLMTEQAVSKILKKCHFHQNDGSIKKSSFKIYLTFFSYFF